MVRENDAGYWYVDIEEAAKGDEYRYCQQTSAGELSRIDPYAREVTSSVGNGVMHNRISIGARTTSKHRRGTSGSFTNCTLAPFTTRTRMNINRPHLMMWWHALTISNA